MTRGSHSMPEAPLTGLRPPRLPTVTWPKALRRQCCCSPVQPESRDRQAALSEQPTAASYNTEGKLKLPTVPTAAAPALLPSWPMLRGDARDAHRSGACATTLPVHRQKPRILGWVLQICESLFSHCSVVLRCNKYVIFYRAEGPLSCENFRYSVLGGSQTGMLSTTPDYLSVRTTRLTAGYELVE